jgi:lipoate-protein ligase A
MPSQTVFSRLSERDRGRANQSAYFAAKRGADGAAHCPYPGGNIRRTRYPDHGKVLTMKCCDLTLASPEENLACDEILLDACETGALEGVLRFWEPTRYFVVVGYANQVMLEVNQAFCQQHDIPILRRCSGGGAVLQGPGCLNYSLVLRIADYPCLAGISGTNDFVLQLHQHALEALLRAPIEKQGYTDLAMGGLKFCGNSQRRRKDFLLFHGCFLLHADIGLIEKALPMPSRQPEYRDNRAHADFLTNLEIPTQPLKAALAKTWKAFHPWPDIPREQIAQLAEQRYKSDAWNFRF